VNLGLQLVQQGLRVLLIDLDHQAAATGLLQADAAAEVMGTADLLGVRQEIHPETGESQILPALSLDDLCMVVHTPAGLDLVASSEALEGADLVLATSEVRAHRLAEALAAARERPWDVILIDTPPSLGLLTVNAMVAADYVLTPLLAAYLSLRAVKRVEATVKRVQLNPRLNPRLKHLGYLLCMVNLRERLAQDARTLLRDHLGTQLWRTEVRTDPAFKADPSQRVRRGRGSDDYAAAALELVGRLKALSKERLQALTTAL